MELRSNHNAKLIKYSLAFIALFFTFLYLMNVEPAWGGPPATSLTITVNDQGTVITAAAYSLAELQAMTQVQHAYTTIDSMPASKFTAAEGIMLKELLTGAGIELNKVTSLKFVATDGYSKTMTREYLLDTPRYFYPNIYSCFDSANYPIFKAGAEDGKTAVEPMIALKAYAARWNTVPQWDKIDGQNALTLCFGQSTISEQTSNSLAKWVNKIEVILAPKAFSVTGNAVTAHDYTMTELKNLQSTTNTFTVNGGNLSCKGVTLTDLLSELNVSGDSLKVQINTSDSAAHPVSPDTLSGICNPTNRYLLTYEINGQAITSDTTPLRVYSTGQVISNVTGITISYPGNGNTAHALYTLTPTIDAAYQNGATADGINILTIKAGVSGLKYFEVHIPPVSAHAGTEAVVFTHLRDGIQTIISTKADYDQVSVAQAGFNVQAGDIVKVYMVDDLTNAVDFNPTILQ